MVPQIEHLASITGSRLHLTRVLWFRGRVHVGFGRTEKALACFQKARQEFLEIGDAYDAALVSVELARIYLEQGRPALVKTLVQEMAPVFLDASIHHNAQAALLLFRRAIEQEAASVEFAVRLLRYMWRAERSPALVFEE
jgi:tetratricopeptide (TPR) repeat protein